MAAGRAGFFESLVKRTTRTSYENTSPIRPAVTPDTLPETFALPTNNIPSVQLDPRFMVASSPYTQEVSTPNTLHKENTTLEGTSNKKVERDHYMPQTEVSDKKISNTTGKPAVSDRSSLVDNPGPRVKPEAEATAKGSTTIPLHLSEKSTAEPFSSLRSKKSANQSQKDARAITSAKPNRVVSSQDIRGVNARTNMDNDKTGKSSPAEGSSEQRQSDEGTAKLPSHVYVKPAPIPNTPVNETATAADNNPSSLDDTYVSESTRAKKLEPISLSSTDREDIVPHSRIYPQEHNISSPMTTQRAKAAPAQDRDVVNINIGRIEVKAVFPQQPGSAAPSKATSTTLSLSEYLKMRAEGKL